MDAISREDLIAKHIRARIERDPRIGFYASALKVAVAAGQIELCGELESIAAKRIALRQAKCVTDIPIIDRIGIATRQRLGDGDIANRLSRLLLNQSEFHRCAVRRKAGGDQIELRVPLGDPSDASGEIALAVEDGEVLLTGAVISLSHMRLAEVLAWWTPGCRNVINALRVSPDEADSDDEINDAVRLALEIDPLFSADPIACRTESGSVRLTGVVPNREIRDMAEHDAWYVPGVVDVDNRLNIHS